MPELTQSDAPSIPPELTARTPETEKRVETTPTTMEKMIQMGINWILLFDRKAPNFAKKLYPKLWTKLGEQFVSSLSVHVKTEMKQRRPWVLDSAMDTEIEINPERQKYDLLVRRAIDHFNESHQESGKHVYYSPNPDRLTLTDFTKLINQKLSPYDQQYVKVHQQNKTYAEILSEQLKDGDAMGMFTTVARAVPDSVATEMTKAMDAARNRMDIASDTSEELSWLRNLKIKIEEIYPERAGVSECLRYFLEVTDGDLARSLYLLASFFKIQARRSEDQLPDSFEHSDPYWIMDHIEDQYSDYVSFNNLPKIEPPDCPPLDIFNLRNALTSTLHQVMPLDILLDRKYPVQFDFSPKNQEGKPYHAAHMVALLNILPPELITMMTLNEYAQFAPLHGFSKFLSDMRIATDLYNLQNMFDKLPKS